LVLGVEVPKELLQFPNANVKADGVFDGAPNFLPALRRSRPGEEIWERNDAGCNGIEEDGTVLGREI
jgi:hypothetical protein